MQIPIEKTVVECSTQKDLLKVSLIFLSYGYYWRDKETITPHNIYGFPVYVCISKNNLSNIHRQKNGRISISNSSDFSKQQKYEIISFNDFINTY